MRRWGIITINLLELSIYHMHLACSQLQQSVNLMCGGCLKLHWDNINSSVKSDFHGSNVSAWLNPTQTMFTVSDFTGRITWLFCYVGPLSDVWIWRPYFKLNTLLPILWALKLEYYSYFYRTLSFSKSGGVHNRLHIYPLWGIFYSPEHYRNQVEGTDGL